MDTPAVLMPKMKEKSDAMQAINNEVRALQRRVQSFHDELTDSRNKRDGKPQ